MPQSLAIRFAPGSNRITSTSGAYAFLWSYTALTVMARVFPEGANANFTIVDWIQGPDSIIGHPNGERVSPVSDYEYGSYNHFKPASGPTDTSMILTVGVKQPSFQPFYWFGVRNGYPQVHLFDARWVGGGSYPGTGMNVVLTAPNKIPAGRCAHCAYTLDWNLAGVGSHILRLYVNGLEVATAALPNANGSFFTYDGPSITCGNSFDTDYITNDVTCRMQELFIYNSIRTAPQIAAEALASPGPLVGPNYRFQWDGIADYQMRGGTTVEIRGTLTDTPACGVSTAKAIPVTTTLAAQTPCMPDAEVGNGGKGAAGCTVGGVGSTQRFDGTIGTVPQHDDPPAGEVLRGQRAPDLIIELFHRTYPADVETAYRYARVPIGHEPDYEGGYKGPGLGAVGTVSLALRDHQASTADVAIIGTLDRSVHAIIAEDDLEGSEAALKLVVDTSRSPSTPAQLVLRGAVTDVKLRNGRLAGFSLVDQLYSPWGALGPDKVDGLPIPATLFAGLNPATAGLYWPRGWGEKTDRGGVDPITNQPRSKGLVPALYMGRISLGALLGAVSPDPPADGTEDASIPVPVIVSTTNAVRAADNPGGWTASTYPFIRAIVNGVRGPWSAVPAPFDPAGVTEPQGIEVFLHFNAVQIAGADNPGGQPLVVYEARVSDDPTYHPETNPNVGLIGSATHDDLTHDSYYGDSDYSLLVRPNTTAAPGSDDTWDLYCLQLGAAYGGPGFELHGSDLGGGDPTKTHDRTKLDLPSVSGSEILVPYDEFGNVDPNWPLATRYIPITDPVTGETFWLFGFLARGPRSDDHKNGVVNFAASYIGYEDVGDGTGNPLVRAFDVWQHWKENFVLRKYTSGLWVTNLTAPMFRDGVYKVNSASYAACQALTVAALGGRGLEVSWFTEWDDAPLVSQRIAEWEDATSAWQCPGDSQGQIKVWMLDVTRDPSTWDRINHVSHMFGELDFDSGVDRANVISGGSCDWDPDASKARVHVEPISSALGIGRLKGLEKPLPPIDTKILRFEDHLRWVMDQHLARRRTGMKIFRAPLPLWANDYAIGDGILFTSEDGPGENGYVDQPCVVIGKSIDFAQKLTTLELWDVGELLLATAFENGLDRLMYETDDDDLAPVETDDEDLAPLEVL